MSVFLNIWIENQKYFSSQNTGLLWVSRATIKSDTNWCHHWQHRVMSAGSAKEAQFISGRACQLTHGLGNLGNPSVSLPLSFILCEDKGWQDFWSPISSKHCLLSASVHSASLPKLNWGVGTQKAMKAWLWSVMHAWQMLRGPGGYSAAWRCYERSWRLGC